jgi:hypothetical protein
VFVRFVVGSDGEHHPELTGIVTEAMLLRDAGRLSAEEAAHLEESYNWLNDHLPVRRSPRGHGRVMLLLGSEMMPMTRLGACGTWCHCWRSTVVRSGSSARKTQLAGSTRTTSRLSWTNGSASE